MLKPSALAAALMLTSSFAYAADNLPSREEMWDMIQMQQKQIKALQKDQNMTQQKVKRAEKKVEKTEKKVQQVEEIANAGTFSDSFASGGWWDRTSVGGYGEMHYNSGNKDQIDFHRYVLFIGHEFSDSIRMFSELEFEHTAIGDGQNGDFFLEQAFLEFDLNDNHKAKAGLFILPIGMLNEIHEPNTFYGVERNPIEVNLIPTTWFEAGAMLSGKFGKGFSYDVALHSGLETDSTSSNAFNVRSSRQKVAKATAKDGAATGRIKWTGIPGVELAASAQYQQDITQSALSEDIDATLWSAHANLREGGWGLKALYAQWNLNGDAPEALGRDRQYGWFIEPSYRFEIAEDHELGFFARYNEYDLNAGNSANTKFQQTDIGMNYWPHPNVVLKADYAILDNPAGIKDDEIVNLGVGFQF